MNAKDVLQDTLKGSRRVTEMILADMSDADLLVRPVNGANHTAWQLGHLINAENRFGNVIKPGSMPALPEGFDQKHGKENANSDRPEDFLTKDEYLKLFKEQRQAVLKLVDELSDADLDKATPEQYQRFAPNVGGLIVLISNHELMHVGQFSTVRRKLGKPVAF